MVAYKLFRIRKNGTIGSLFINQRQIIPIGQWLTAEDHPTPGYAHRFGWHATTTPHAPHLSMKNRAWYKVEVNDDAPILQRPASQGTWVLAKHLKVIERLRSKS